MARRTVLTGRQRSALFSLPQHEADLLRHYTLSDEDLQVLTLFKALCRRHPGRFQEGQLRTLQRRVRDWRVSTVRTARCTSSRWRSQGLQPPIRAPPPQQLAHGARQLHPAQARTVAHNLADQRDRGQPWRSVVAFSRHSWREGHAIHGAKGRRARRLSSKPKGDPPRHAGCRRYLAGRSRTRQSRCRPRRPGCSRPGRGGESVAEAAGERADERDEDDQGQGRRVRLAGAGAGREGLDTARCRPRPTGQWRPASFSGGSQMNKSSSHRSFLFPVSWHGYCCPLVAAQLETGKEQKR